MNNKVYVGIAFVIGAAAGSVASWFVLKKKYERIAQEEIDSVKEVYSRVSRETADEKKTESSEETETSEEDEAVSEVETEITRLGYRDYSDISNTRNKKEVKKKMMGYTPSVITPEEFGDVDGYDTQTLTYYADGVLTDDADYPIEDIEETIGYESLNHFGEYEDECVHVRNDALRTDYEILYDPRNYSDVVGITSGQSED